MYQVKKRDGKVAEFNLKKIGAAITKAFEAQNLETHPDIIDVLALRVTADFMPKVTDGFVRVEDIQDSVEAVLIQAGYGEVAKGYILYRKQREKIRNMKSTVLDYKEIVNNYVNVNDWRVKENSTVTYSVGGLILSNSGAITANYWLSEIYDDEISSAHRNADIHIHDLSMLTGYCAGWSLKQLIQEGLGGVPGKITSAPAKHLGTLCNQMVNFLGIMQNEWAGAQAFSSFDTYLAPFVKVDNLTYDQVKKSIESFIYGVNTPSRWGTQSPFTNITLDWTVPNDLAELPAIVGGKEMDFKYKDCKREMDMINRAFLEVMIEGDANGRGFQYPIPTYSITRDFDWSDSENNRLLFEMTAKYGTPYFSNYINSDMEPSDVRSMCCRLRLDLRELRKKSGGFFGSGESTGSVGVVTINLPRIAYLSGSEAEFYKRLDHLMDISARSLSVKRQIITKLLNEGLYPYTKKYLGTFANHFSTIGLVGMNEAGLNARWIRADMTHEKTQNFAKDVLNHMRERLSDYQEIYGDLYNLEATPAESTTYRLAKHDKAQFPDIITASENGTPYYTNSSHLPVGYTADIFAALDIQDELQTLYTSGTVFHAFLGEKLPDWRAAASLVRKIAENYRLPYYTMSPTYSVCKDHGYLTGEQYTCPHCGGETEVYSRITGYYRPVQNWNDGKAQEFVERKVYDIENSVLKPRTVAQEILEQAAAPQPVPVVSVAPVEVVEEVVTPVVAEEPVASVEVVEEVVAPVVAEEPVAPVAAVAAAVVAPVVAAAAVATPTVAEEPVAPVEVVEEVVAPVVAEEPVTPVATVAAAAAAVVTPVAVAAAAVVTPTVAEDPVAPVEVVEEVVVPAAEAPVAPVEVVEEVVAPVVAEEPVTPATTVEEAVPAKVKTYLFTTKTCPNCRIVTMHLDEADIEYEKVDAEETPDMVEQYGIRQAPTLVVVKDGEAKTYTNASSIIGYIADH